MSADFGFIAHAAERDGRAKFASERIGHAFAKESFADTGRTDQTEDRAFDCFTTFEHGKKFKQTIPLRF